GTLGCESHPSHFDKLGHNQSFGLAVSLLASHEFAYSRYAFEATYAHQNRRYQTLLSQDDAPEYSMLQSCRNHFRFQALQQYRNLPMQKTHEYASSFL